MTVSQTSQPQSSVLDTSPACPLSVTGCRVEDSERRENSGKESGHSTSTCLEITVMDLIQDPLVDLVNRADGVSNEAFAELLLSAARWQGRRSHK